MSKYGMCVDKFFHPQGHDLTLAYQPRNGQWYPVDNVQELLQKMEDYVEKDPQYMKHGIYVCMPLANEWQKRLAPWMWQHRQTLTMDGLRLLAQQEKLMEAFS